MKQINFETIGSAYQEPRASNLTGLQRGETDAVTLSNGAQSKLEAQTPIETDRNLLASLEKLFGLRKSLRGTVMTGEPDLAMVPIGNDYDYQSAMSAVRLAMTPADPNNIAKAYAECVARFPSVREDQDSAKAAVAVSIRTLMKYPADVARAALEGWSGDWAPRADGLEKACERLVQKRRNLLASLEWSAKQPITALLPKPAPERPVDFDEAPVLSVDPAPPVRSAQSMAEALRQMGG